MVSNFNRPSTSTLTAFVRRLLEGGVTAWAAVTVAFFALRIVSGDPVASLLSQGLATPTQVESLREELGLNKPITVQYFRFLAGISRLDLGDSLYTQRPVSQTIAEQLPSTVELALTGLSIALILGLGLGLIASWKENSFLGRLGSTIAGFSTALPVAFTGILALGIIRQTTIEIRGPTASSLQQLLLPALVLGFSAAGPIARVVHSGLRESLKAQYILAARARGIHGARRLLWHALRPALPPVISLISLEAAFLFGGTVVTETVFSRPGLGRLLVQSILQGDFPIAQGLVVLAALFYTASQVFADLTAMILDPRLRSST